MTPEQNKNVHHSKEVLQVDVKKRNDVQGLVQ